jgi:uncharacterized protein
MNIIIFGCGNIGFEIVKNLVKVTKVENIYVFNRSYPVQLKELLESSPLAKKIINYYQVAAEDEEAVEKVYSSIIKEKINILISTTGTSSPADPLINFNRFKSDFDLNYYSGLVPIKAAVSNKILSVNARIIVISSTSGHHAPNDLKAYAPSKWAIENIYASLRNDLKSKRIDVDIISPTTIRNKYSKVFKNTNGIAPELVATVVTKIVRNTEIGRTKRGKNYFVPHYYCLVHFVERIFPSVLNFRFGLKSEYKRKRVYKQHILESGLITGAASGLGKELAYIYSKRLKNIYLVDKNKKGLEEVKDEIESNSNCSVSTHCIDLNDLQEVISLADNLPSVDLLINCAGIYVVGAVYDATISDCSKALNTNFYAPALFISKLLMKNNAPKKIVNILSTTAIAGRKNFGVYSSSKAALWSFTRSLRRIYGNEMQIIEVIPATFKSNLSQNGITLNGKADQSQDKSKLPSENHIATTIYNANYIATTIHNNEREGREIIITPFKAKLYFMLDAFFPYIRNLLFK